MQIKYNNNTDTADSINIEI